MTDIVRIRTIIEAAEHPESTQPLTHKLASMYDHQRQRADKAEADAQNLREQIDSTVERLATSVSQYLAVDLVPGTFDPTVWTLKLRAKLAEIRFLSAHPRYWDKRILYGVGTELGKQFGRMVLDEMQQKVEGDK
jgi:hypothetical protein